MNQFVANLRRVAVVLAVVTLSAPSLPARVLAQSDARPANAAPDSTAAPAAPDSSAAPAAAPATPSAPATPAALTTGKPAKGKKVPKAPRIKVAKAAAAPAPRKEKPAKAPKAPVARAPEPSREEQKKADGIYAKGTNWLGMKFGYAKRTGDVNGDGFVGYGVTYQHMISKKYAFAAGAGHDVVGHFSHQLDIAVPFTAEFQRHFNWKTAVRPFVGLGGGYYFRKFYRTGLDYNTTTSGGPHVSFGFTSALDDRHVIGVEARWAQVSGRPGIVNPTFGKGQDTETIWTAKLSWGLAY